jgi:uncharacterized membrane protein YfcA
VGVPPVSALATSKIQGTFGVATATFNYWRKGKVSFAVLKWPLVAAAIGAGLGSFAVTFVDTKWLMALLPVLLVAIAFYFWLGPKASDDDAHARMTPVAYSSVAGGIGFYDGFFGPGTGSFFALSLVTLLGMGLTRATANTKALNFATNLVSVAIFTISGKTLWVIGLCMAVGQVMGGWLGSHAAMRFGPKLIRPLLVVVCFAMVAKLLSDPANPLRTLIAGAWG